MMCHSLILMWAGAALAGAQSAASNSLAFQPGAQGSFLFDTGELRGVLRTGGKSFGLQSVVHIPSGRRVDAGSGLFGHYRVFTTGKRYGGGAWDWPSTARLTEHGAVEVLWPATEDRPFEMRAVYRWATPSALDLETTVVAKQDLPGFESFLASYFTSGFTNAMAATGMASGQAKTPLFLPAERSAGEWQMFPRDDAAVGVIQDGRWKLLPNPVDWAIRPRFLHPLAIRCDKTANLSAVVMARRQACFAVAMPHETEGHFSLYLSQFGRDLKAGETARAEARLVILDSVSQERFARAWEDFENRPSGESASEP
jgi:hypothetical protein